MKQLYEWVQEFNETAGLTAVTPGNIPSDDVLDLRIKLIEEEFIEFQNAIGTVHYTQECGTKQEYRQALGDVADAICDLLYVVTGAGIEWGFPLPEMMRMVHDANMGKFPGGKVYRRKDGKIVKPPGWHHADLALLLGDDE